MQNISPIWVSVVGYYAPFYEVSNYGQVRCKESGLIRKTTKDRNGYPCVTLKHKGKQKAIRVHRLVAEAFIPNPNNYPIINHKNENRDDNRAENLEWCTYLHNNTYNGASKRRGNKTSMEIAQYTKDNKLVNTYRNAKEASIALGLNKAAASNISSCAGFYQGNNKCREKHCSAYGYIWKFANYENRPIGRKIILQFNHKGELIGKYDGLADASDKTGIKAEQIRSCCRYKYLHTKSYIWRYEDDCELPV